MDITVAALVAVVLFGLLSIAAMAWQTQRQERHLLAVVDRFMSRTFPEYIVAKGDSLPEVVNEPSDSLDDLDRRAAKKAQEEMERMLKIAGVKPEGME